MLGDQIKNFKIIFKDGSFYSVKHHFMRVPLENVDDIVQLDITTELGDFSLYRILGAYFTTIKDFNVDTARDLLHKCLIAQLQIRYELHGDLAAYISNYYKNHRSTPYITNLFQVLPDFADGLFSIPKFVSDFSLGYSGDILCSYIGYEDETVQKILYLKEHFPDTYIFFRQPL